MNCSLCNNQINIINKHYIYDNCICHGCFKNYPSFIRNKINTYNSSQLKLVRDYFDKARTFNKTASYGILEIDEINGTFRIFDYGKAFTFDCNDVKAVDIICTEPRVNKHNVVFCDVELFYVSISPRIELRINIKENVKCKSTRKGDKLIWEYPSDLSMFINMFNQMLKNTRKKYQNDYETYLVTKENIELLKAKSLFLVDDTYTIDELKQTMKNLMKVYHPDEASGDNEKAKIINRYYEILKERL